MDCGGGGWPGRQHFDAHGNLLFKFHLFVPVPGNGRRFICSSFLSVWRGGGGATIGGFLIPNTVIWYSNKVIRMIDLKPNCLFPVESWTQKMILCVWGRLKRFCEDRQNFYMSTTHKTYILWDLVIRCCHNKCLHIEVKLQNNFLRSGRQPLRGRRW